MEYQIISKKYLGHKQPPSREYERKGSYNSDRSSNKKPQIFEGDLRTDIIRDIVLEGQNRFCDSGFEYSVNFQWRISVCISLTSDKGRACYSNTPYSFLP